MQCSKCKYIMDEFDKECPRCALNKKNLRGETKDREDVVRNTEFKPSKIALIHPFPRSGKTTLRRDGQRFGPYSLDEINSLLKDGSINQSDQALLDNGDWVVVRKINGVVIPPPSGNSKLSPIPVPLQANTNQNTTSYIQPLPDPQAPQVFPQQSSQQDFGIRHKGGFTNGIGAGAGMGIGCCCLFPLIIFGLFIFLAALGASH